MVKTLFSYSKTGTLFMTQFQCLQSNLTRFVPRQVYLVVVFVGLSIGSSDLMAAGAGMPWEGPLAQFLQSITGPVAQAFSIGAITLTGLGLAFGQTQGMMLKLLQISFGLSIAFAAAGFFLPLFGFAGGAAF